MKAKVGKHEEKKCRNCELRPVAFLFHGCKHKVCVVCDVAARRKKGTGNLPACPCGQSEGEDCAIQAQQAGAMGRVRLPEAPLPMQVLPSVPRALKEGDAPDASESIDAEQG